MADTIDTSRGSYANRFANANPLGREAFLPVVEALNIVNGTDIPALHAADAALESHVDDSSSGAIRRVLAVLETEGDLPGSPEVGDAYFVGEDFTIRTCTSASPVAWSTDTSPADFVAVYDIDGGRSYLWDKGTMKQWANNLTTIRAGLLLSHVASVEGLSAVLYDVVTGCLGAASDSVTVATTGDDPDAIAATATVAFGAALSYRPSGDYVGLVANVGSGRTKVWLRTLGGRCFPVLDDASAEGDVSLYWSATDAIVGVLGGARSVTSSAEHSDAIEA